MACFFYYDVYNDMHTSSNTGKLMSKILQTKILILIFSCFDVLVINTCIYNQCKWYILDHMYRNVDFKECLYAENVQAIIAAVTVRIICTSKSIVNRGISVCSYPGLFPEQRAYL